MIKIQNDFSYSAFVAGLIAVLVGYTSSAIIVFQAASASGATVLEASSWLGILCVGMGVLTVFFSLKTKTPVMFAWSTAGGALLCTSVEGLALSEIVGAFVFSALLIFLSGVTGLFERVLNRIPVGISSAMLAGVLLHFALDVFSSIKLNNWLVTIMFVTYVFGRRLYPRFNIVVVLLVGVAISKFQNNLSIPPLEFALLNPVFVKPTFNLTALMNIGIPLFIVTMSSQNLTGVAVMRAYQYEPQISKYITWSGFMNLIIAPFGGFALNLSALTAAICMGPEAHADRNKRYMAAASSGVMYVLIGLFSSSVVGFFNAFPKVLILTIAGLALMGTITSSLTNAVSKESEREAAMITFFVTASGVTFLGIGAAFWGLLAGAMTSLVLNFRKNH